VFGALTCRKTSSWILSDDLSDLKRVKTTRRRRERMVRSLVVERSSRYLQTDVERIGWREVGRGKVKIYHKHATHV